MFYDTKAEIKVNVSFGASSADYTIPFDNSHDRFTQLSSIKYNDYAIREGEVEKLDKIFFQSQNTVVNAIYFFFERKHPIVALGLGSLSDEFYAMVDANNEEEVVFKNVFCEEFGHSCIRATVVIQPTGKE